MVRVILSSALQSPCGVHQEPLLTGETVGDLVDALAAQYPDSRAVLMLGNRLRPGILVALDGRFSSLGLHQPVTDAREVVFLCGVFGG